MTYGYCRISTPRHNIDHQIRNIKTEYLDVVFCRESYTVTKLDRPEWHKLYRRLQTVDTIVFEFVSNMSRNTEDSIALYIDSLLTLLLEFWCCTITQLYMFCVVGITL